MADLHEIQVDDLKEGSKKFISFKGHPIALFCVEGEYYAIEDMCTHAEASLSEGFLDGYDIECPMHGARFDIRSGEVLSMPAYHDVKTYPIHKKDGKVFIEL